MRLARFLPYQLAVLTEQVSRCMAQVYNERFDITRDEWRVLAVLYEQPSMKTTEVIASATLDKMQASRAIARLEAAGMVSRTSDGDDRRHRVLQLQPPGRALVKRIIPLVEAREAFLLEGLDDAERAVLDRALEKLTQRARQLVRQG